MMQSQLTTLRLTAAQIVSRCRELAAITDTPGQTTRVFLSPATRAAHALVTEWMREAGLTVTIDAIGNLHGLTADAAAGTPRLLIGSHLDTVVDAGAFDGPLGVLCGIALAAHCRALRLGFALEVVAFSEEEGVRFRRPYLGSLAIVGESVSGTITDRQGVTLTEALTTFGHTATAPSEIAPEAFAYLELHIEQGPVLESERRAIAAVQSIVGQSRLEVHFEGHANHAGTTPMHLRQDALAAAAEWMVSVEAHARQTPGLVATVGGLTVAPGLSNVIAGSATLSLDVRHGEDQIRVASVETLLKLAAEAGTQRGVRCSSTVLLDQAAVAMDASLTAGLVAAAARHGHNATPMPSGAGHDAMILARRVPAAMLFLRTPGGLSHHPDESVYVEDVEAALATGLSFLEDLKPAPGAW